MSLCESKYYFWTDSELFLGASVRQRTCSVSRTYMHRKEGVKFSQGKAKARTHTLARLDDEAGEFE
jgi:hypothetical protein